MCGAFRSDEEKNSREVSETVSCSITLFGTGYLDQVAAAAWYVRDRAAEWADWAD